MTSRAARLATAAVAIVQVACDTRDEGLVAVVQLESGVPATCLSLTVFEPDTAPPRQLGEAHLVIQPGQLEYRFAIYRGTSADALPEEVVVRAQALAGSGCASPLDPVSSSEEVRMRFKSRPPWDFTLTVPRPAPGALVIRDVPPVILAGDCVAAAVDATSMGRATPVAEHLPVTLSVAPASGLTVYSDGACTNAISGRTIPAGSSALAFHLRGDSQGPYTLTASAAGLTSGTADTNVVLEPAASIAFATPPWTSLSGACLGPVRVQPVSADGGASLLPVDAALSLSSTLSGVTFATDAVCSQNIATVPLAAGAPEASFYFRSRAVGPVPLRVASAFGLTTQTQQIIPSVRTGSCAMNPGVNTVTCPVPPPGALDLSRAFLIAQAVSDDNTPDGVNVRCWMADAGAIDCRRAAGAGRVEVGWQLVELASGIRVQRATNASCAGTNLVTLPQPFDPARTFVLFTAETGGGSVGTDDYRTVRLVGNNQVEVLHVNDCGGSVELQVVELDGASVERGALDAGTTPVSATTTSAVDVTRTILLSSARFTGGSMLCGYMVRGAIASTTSVAFTRGDGNDAVCQVPDITAIAWERIQLPAGARVHTTEVTMADGELTAAVTIPAVDLNRSFVLSSNQFNGGPAFGETSYNADDRPGAAGARHVLTAPTRLELTRGFDGGTARWTSYVVELP